MSPKKDVPPCLLNLDKPPGPTSRTVVDRVVRVTGCRKVGHAGTLDPLATGVLVVCVGRATRLVPFVQQLPKRYRAVFRFGLTSPTDDVDGPVAELPEAPVIDESRLRAVLPAFVGRIEQVPPVYSAVKIDGRRAYQKARSGRTVLLAPRTVTVYDLRLVRFHYPDFELEICCSGGTYVRALGRDIGKSLGTAAIMVSLTRTAIGPFRVEQAVRPEGLQPEAWQDHALPPAAAVPHLRRFEGDETVLRALRHGQAVPMDRLRPLPPPILDWAPPGWQPPEDVSAVFDDAGRLVALVRHQRWRFQPCLVLD
ncbi:MAG: tRNA pseudouridine(55) synthase TruB [Planctomycetota bacterium]|nr:MAG: tRNA pseudouridine(55) synthase TruB [Planctomycetota bacterium]